MSSAPVEEPSRTPEEPTRSGFLPPIGSTSYYLLLGAVAIFVLGPLGGVTAAYMNFSLGFFVGGQVLAGILGSAITYGYGAEGKHGANYMQTMAASVAGMSGMAVLVQAMVWLGLEQPPAWALVLYFLCIGMFGVGVGMLYTPFLVDRMQLTFPSGFAVANILRALTDKRLLQASIGKLGSGAIMGFLGGFAGNYLAPIGNLGLSTSTVGAGMVVGARIAVPGMVVGLLGEVLTPTLVDIGWLAAGEPFRKIGFIIALGSILGAAIVDMTILAYKTIGELGKPKSDAVAGEEWKQQNTWRLVGWVGFWGLGVVIVATQVLALPLLYVLIAMGLVFLFLIINGISTGISDSNPISSAFVLTVFVLAFVGLTEPAVGLMCAAILLIATSIGVDMQQDRSTGWRLGTNRVIQFRFQVVGVVMGAFMAVAFAKIFMSAYPVLEINQFAHGTEQHAAEEAAAADRAEIEAKAAASAQDAATRAAAARQASVEAQDAIEAAREAQDPMALSVALEQAAVAADRASAEAEAASVAAASATPPAAPVVDPALAEAQEAEAAQIRRWQSAMTYKFVGALSGLTNPSPYVMTALWLGIGIGFLIELLRKIIKNLGAWRRFSDSGKIGFAADFCLDAIVLPSPYAASFGGFVDFLTTVWFASGGVLTSFASTVEDETKHTFKQNLAAAQGAAGPDAAAQHTSLPVEGEVVPEDMSTTSLVGGGLIAGDSLAALSLGILGLLGTLFG